MTDDEILREFFRKLMKTLTPQELKATFGEDYLTYQNGNPFLYFQDENGNEINVLGETKDNVISVDFTKKEKVD